MNDDPTRNYHGNHPNSNEAHNRTRHNKPRDYARIINLLADHRAGLTCDEAEVMLGMLHQTCSARFTEMKALGWIVWSGKRATRTGSPADVWRLSPPTSGLPLFDNSYPAHAGDTPK